ncbi:MAG: hypothetical protein R3E99_07200 [Burkholderiaceae bacterium]
MRFFRRTQPQITDHPPVPRVLQEALQDYPELITGLQEVLSKLGTYPGMNRFRRTDQFEAAIWSLEGRLDSYLARAARELREAEVTGDPVMIARAREKKLLMGGCRHEFGADELAEFFRWGQD